MKYKETEKINRKPAVAGKFYPESKDELQQHLQMLFKNAKSKLDARQQLQALISPHAGYIFSGNVAASAFNLIHEDTHYKRVFVLASSHRFHFNGASVYSIGNYETPLGEVEVDTKLTKNLLKSSDIIQDKPEVHTNEHSIEVQLPFLQYKLGKSFKLVPIILGTNDAADCKRIATALKPWFTPENLFVVSSDFSHYPDYDHACKIDFITAKSICRNNSKHLLSALKKNSSLNIKNLSTSLCGWTSVLTLLYLTESKDYLYTEIDYQNSGDAKKYGDKKQVVGYWAIAVFNKNAPFTIAQNEKKEILKQASNAIINYIETGKKRKPIATNMGGILNEKIGAFVSVYVAGKLRGCIGGFAQNKTLNEIVQLMAVSSVTDHRFQAVQADDLKDMTLEISILSPLKKIKSASEIELGRHGIFIQKNLNTGTFLPQVAKKTGWNVNEFLGHCSRDKAGMGWDDWKTADLFTYEAIILKAKLL